MINSLGICEFIKEKSRPYMGVTKFSTDLHNSQDHRNEEEFLRNSHPFAQLIVLI